VPGEHRDRMESLNLLKQEINQTMESEHDFAKWKLIVVAGLGGTALGLSKDSHPVPWLLLFIPFVCGYIDLHLSQYQARILVLAQFIRGYRPAEGAAVSDNVLQDYEKYVNDLRLNKGHFFDLGQFANHVASLVLSLASLITIVPSWKTSPSPHFTFWMWLVVWLAGVGVIVVIWGSHRRRLARLKESERPAR
jgi:hypothetical protein